MSLNESALLPSASVVLKAGVPCLQITVPLSHSASLRNRFENVDGIRDAFFPPVVNGKAKAALMTSRDQWPVKMNKEAEVTGYGVYDLPAISLTGGPEGARVSVGINCPAGTGKGQGTITTSDVDRILRAALADFAAQASGTAKGSVERTAKRPKGGRASGTRKADAIQDAQVSAIVAGHASEGGPAAGDVVGIQTTEGGATVKHLAPGVAGNTL